MSDQLDPEKFHVLNKSQKVIVTCITLVILLLIVPLLSYVYYNFAINRPAQSDKDTVFEIKRGDSLSDIADKLWEDGLINSKFLFMVYTRLNNLDSNIQAGVYEINSSMSIVAITNLLQHGTDDTKVTFLEGWRVEEFAREASKKLTNIDYEKFVMTMRNSEGFLYPDTYFLNTNTTEEELLQTFLSNFDEKTKRIHSADALNKLGITHLHIISLASIVEREVHNQEDRKLVAGILINRFVDGEPLGADATVQYIAARLRLGCPVVLEYKVCPTDDVAKDVEWWPDDLTIDELSYDSVYNTRKNVGIPPAISNPGISAIDAVIDYTPSEYKYYLTDSDGVTHYAVTYAEHNDNIAKYLSQ